MTGALFGLAALFAAADWYAVAREIKPLEYICKPATLAALIGAALAIDPTGPATRKAFVVALAFSLAGDVFLMLPKNLFIPGLASFLVAHIAYTVGFAHGFHNGIGYTVVQVAVIAAIGTVGGRVVRSIWPDDRILALAVIAYILAIGTMVTFALHSGIVLALFGAALFAFSDSVIAWNRFVRPLPWAPLAIIVTYHLAQGALVVSLRL